MKGENIFSDSWGESIFCEKSHVWVQIEKIPGLAFTNRHVHASVNKKCKYEFKKARDKLHSNSSDRFGDIRYKSRQRTVGFTTSCLCSLQQRPLQLTVHRLHTRGHRSRQRDHRPHQHAQDSGQLLRRASFQSRQGPIRQWVGEDARHPGR